MATTTASAFTEFASNLEITDRQEKAVSNCRVNVTKTISSVLKLHDPQSLVIGSYDRHTLTRYLSEGDVDLMVIMHYGANSAWHNSAGVNSALRKFKDILQDRYKKTEMNVDVNCVTMKLSDFRLDVIPAFKFDDNTYIIPDTVRKTWINTDPISFASLITNVNRNMDETFVPLIKMVKAWNRDSGWPIRSIHLETMLYEHFKNYNQSNPYDNMLYTFFQALPRYLNYECYEPITNDRVDSYLDTTVTRSRASAIRKAQAAATSSQQAMFAGLFGDRNAIIKWKQMMGDFYPNYG